MKSQRDYFSLFGTGKRFAAVAVSLWLNCASFPSIANDESGLLSNFETGKLAFESQNYTAAITAFAKAHKESPEYNVINYYLAESYYRSGQFNESIAAVEKYVDNLNQSQRATFASRAYFLFGQALFAISRFKEAAEQFDNAIVYANKPERYRYDRRIEALIKSNAGVDEIIDTLDRGIAAMSSVEDYALTAVDLEIDSHQFENALRRLNYLLKIRPKHSVLLSKKAFVYQELGLEVEAKQEFNAALKFLQATKTEDPKLNIVQLRTHIEAQLAQLK